MKNKKCPYCTFEATYSVGTSAIPIVFRVCPNCDYKWAIGPEPDLTNREINVLTNFAQNGWQTGEQAMFGYYSQQIRETLLELSQRGYIQWREVRKYNITEKGREALTKALSE